LARISSKGRNENSADSLVTPTATKQQRSRTVVSRRSQEIWKTRQLSNQLSSRPTPSPWSATTGVSSAHSLAVQQHQPIRAIRSTSKLLRHALDAAAQAPSHERLVFSSLQNFSKWSNGKCKHVYNFNYKARAAENAAGAHAELRAKTSVFLADWSLGDYLTGPRARPQDVSSMGSSALIRE
jgi:hypothetical protein